MRDVFVGYMHNGATAGAFTDSMVRMLLWDRDHDDRIADIAIVCSGPRLAHSRNNMVAAMLEEADRFEWAFFVDADMAFSPDALDALLATADPEERPIVSGLAFSVGIYGETEPCIFRYRDHPDGKGPALCQPGNLPFNELIWVDAAGAACLLVHRQVLEDILAKYGDRHYIWFEEELDHRGNEVGEDVTFCLRARDCGFPLHAHTGIPFGHLKLHPFGIPEWIRYRTKVREQGKEATLAQLGNERALNLLGDA